MVCNPRMRSAWTAILATLCSQAALGQSAPWLTFTDDPISASVCDVVNGSNVELVVLDGTRQLTIVTGTDVTIGDTFVDVGTGEVIFEGRSFGFVEFAEDGDGFRTLWWVSFTGRVIGLDESTGFPGTVRERSLS